MCYPVQFDRCKSNSMGIVGGHPKIGDAGPPPLGMRSVTRTLDMGVADPLEICSSPPDLHCVEWDVKL